MPPSAPIAIFTPPSAGSPPAAAGAIYEPAPTGKGSLVISGVSTAGVNGTVNYVGLVNGRPAWSADGTLVAGPTNEIVDYTGTAWRVSMGSSYSATKTSAAATPDGLTAWTVGTGTGSPVLTAASVPSPPVVFTAP